MRAQIAAFAVFIYSSHSIALSVPHAEIKSAPITNSEKYSPLIEDSELRMRFTDGQNQKLGRYFKGNSSHARVKVLLGNLFSGPVVRANLKVGDSFEVQWVDLGPGKPSEVNLIDTSGTTTTRRLFTTRNQEFSYATVISEIILSPLQDYLVVVLAKFGSIDQKTALVINLKTRSEEARLEFYHASYSWVSPTSLHYMRMEEDGSDQSAIFDVTTGIETVVKSYLDGQSQDLTLLGEVVDDKEIQTLINKNTGAHTTITLPEGRVELRSNDKTHAYFLVQKKGESQILAVDWTSLQSATPLPLTVQPFVIENQLFIDQLWLGADTVFTHQRMAERRTLRAYMARTGQLLAEIELPDCCSVIGVSWGTVGKTLNVNVTSPTVARGLLVYNLDTGKWNKDLDVFLTADGLRLKSETFRSISADGTSIPARRIYRADLARNGSNPVLIKSYGGFFSAGHFDPRFDRALLEFLKRGGIFVGPALRGGNELGKAWHEQATHDNKIKTFEDLVSVARQLVSEGWTSSRRIAIQGTSNGGLTAAATALLFPDDFGLAIPIAGVVDLLGKDRLDSIYQGWSYEYGSVAKNFASLQKISPLENVSRQGRVRFFIVDGAQDTRVNSAHSVKLAKALLDQGGSPANTFLYTVPNAGHGAESITVNGSIGLSVAVGIWSMIYDMAGF